MIYKRRSLRIGFLASHPIQYLSPLFRQLSKIVDLQVFYAHEPSPQQQASAGFDVAFEWDSDLLTGYDYTFLHNVARNPEARAGHFFGCDTPEIKQRIETGNFDVFIVNGWYLKSFWQAVLACLRTGVPVLARGDSQLQATNSLSRRIIKKVSYPFILRAFNGFLSPGTRFDKYLEHYGIPSDRIYRVPHCIDNQWFGKRACDARQAGVPSQLRESFGIRNAHVILFVGKFIPKKRPSDIIDAVRQLKGYSAPVAAVFVGSGPLDVSLRESVKEGGLPVYFAGFKNQSELPAYYAMADVLVLPSSGKETWGLVVNEAMACGTPVLVSEAVGCRPDLVVDGITGFTYPTGDVRKLAAAVQQFISQKEQTHDFSQAVREHIQNFSTETAAHKIVNATEAAALEQSRNNSNLLFSPK